MSAKENIAKLPEWCYGKLLMDTSVIKIYAGEMGYYPFGGVPPLDVNETVDEFIDEWNLNIGVTKGMRAAMEQGSMFGWHIGAANVDNYDVDGHWTKEYIMSLKK